MNPSEYEDKYANRLKDYRKEFVGKHKPQIERLRSCLTEDDLKEILPETEDPEIYASLMREVQAAADKNETIAQFEQRVLRLGKKAVEFVRKIPVA